MREDQYQLLVKVRAETLLSGDEEIWQPFYAEAQRFCMGYFVSKEIEVWRAEELTHELLIRLLGALSSYTGEKPLLNFISTVARNMYIDEERRKETNVSKGLVGLEEASTIRDEAGDPERELLKGESLEDMERVLEILTPEQRVVVKARVFEEMDYKEIAEKLREMGEGDQDVNALQMKNNRGLRRLQRKLNRNLLSEV